MTKNNIIRISGNQTYREAIENHISQCSEEDLNAPVTDMILIGNLETRGSLYSILEGDDIAKILGLLEVAKFHLMATGVEDGTGDY